MVFASHTIKVISHKNSHIFIMMHAIFIAIRALILGRGWGHLMGGGEKFTPQGFK
jgi:hypothetical protein